VALFCQLLPHAGEAKHARGGSRWRRSASVRLSPMLAARNTGHDPQFTMSNSPVRAWTPDNLAI